MKAIITVEFEIDGENPGEDKLELAIQDLLGGCGYIGSEVIDKTEDWGVMIGIAEVEIVDDVDEDEK
ncbi:MAG: hypothetical protein EOM12_03530 [Verrucomicrobiae bacterium]|nr:hypothetical protein [Verrucomicrobiae bacterium]